jgi:hypothetical protein
LHNISSMRQVRGESPKTRGSRSNVPARAVFSIFIVSSGRVMAALNDHIVNQQRYAPLHWRAHQSESFGVAGLSALKDCVKYGGLARRNTLLHHGAQGSGGEGSYGSSEAVYALKL